MKILFKKVIALIWLLYLRFIKIISYKYYLKHYPKYLQWTGIKFSGNIENTGFISMSAKFDSFSYAYLFEIGENTIISSDVNFLVHDYSISTALRIVDGCEKGNLPHFLKGIKIGNNCFIGMRSIILPGTTIGDNTIIGAGSVVKGEIPPNVVVAGNPGKIIKTIEEYAAIHKEKKDYIFRK